MLCIYDWNSQFRRDSMLDNDASRLMVSHKIKGIIICGIFCRRVYSNCDKKKIPNTIDTIDIVIVIISDSTRRW